LISVGRIGWVLQQESNFNPNKTWVSLIPHTLIIIQNGMWLNFNEDFSCFFLPRLSGSGSIPDLSLFGRRSGPESLGLLTGSGSGGGGSNLSSAELHAAAAAAAYSRLTPYMDPASLYALHASPAQGLRLSPMDARGKGTSLQFMTLDAPNGINNSNWKLILNEEGGLFLWNLPFSPLWILKMWSLDLCITVLSFTLPYWRLNWGEAFVGFLVSHHPQIWNPCKSQSQST